MKCNFHSKLRSKCTEPQVYMAPEAMEKDEFTKAADVYSFSKRYVIHSHCVCILLCVDRYDNV